MQILRKVGAAVAVLAVMFVANGADAQNAGDVSKMVSLLNGELKLLNEANLTESEGTQGQAILSDRQPRHVMQKAREVFLQVQALREINGLSANNIPSFPAKEFGAVDVKSIVDQILSDTREMRDSYGATAEATPEGSGGDSWSDVYESLNEAGAALVALGVPAADANTVYRIAATVVSDLEKIRAAKGISAPVADVPVPSAKKPGDVYNLALELMAELKALSEKDASLSVPGDVKPLAKKSNEIHGSDVLDVMNNALAEVIAMKAAAGVSDASVLAPAQSGKSPAQVFAEVTKAIAMVGSL